MTSSEGGGGGGGSKQPARSGKKSQQQQQQRQQSPVPRKNSSASEKDEDPVLQSIASKPSVLHSPQVTLTCYIPSQSVGAVIGRRGTNIAQIQRHAQQYGSVRVSIVGHDDTAESSVPYTFTELDWSSPDWTPVVIRGDPCAVICAAQRLRDYAGGDMDDVVLDVPLNRGNFSKLIGKRGMVLASLSADTNVRIMVPQRALRIDLFQLEGELDNVKVCLEKIVVLLSSLKKKTTGEENTVSASVQVPTLPSQTKLRVVARKTETSLQKRRQSDESWLITVWGQDAEHVDNAIGMLESWKMHQQNAAVQTRSSTTPPPQRRSKAQNRKIKIGKKGGGKGGSTPTQSASSPPAGGLPEAPPVAES